MLEHVTMASLIFFLLLRAVPFTVTHLQGQDLLVDSEEDGHGSGPRQQAGHVAAHAVSGVHVVVLHIEIWLQEFHHLIVDGVLREILEGQQECCAGHHLKGRTLFEIFQNHYIKRHIVYIRVVLVWRYIYTRTTAAPL